MKKAVREKEENLYKLLGTRANISQTRIREKYAAQIRKYPPETHPKEFQEIRRAYDILRDPEKRRRYDASRRGVPSQKDIRAEVAVLFSSQEYPKAITLLKEYLQTHSDIILHMLLLRAYEENGDLEEAFAELANIRNSIGPERRYELLPIEINLFITMQKFDEAEQILKSFSATGIDEIKALATAASNLAGELVDAGHPKRAWKMFQSILPPPKEHRPPDGPLLLALIWVVGYSEHWDRKSEVSQRIRHWARQTLDEQSTQLAVEEALDDIETYWNDGRLREVDLVSELLMQVDRHEPLHKEWHNKARSMQKPFKELLKLRRDQNVFVGVKEMIEIWFAQEAEQFERYSRSDLRLLDLDEQMELYDFPDRSHLHFAVANGIHRVRKQYPILFKLLQSDLENVLIDCSSTLTRKEQLLAKKDLSRL